jgi:ketosteroid isomerase-like protein
MSEESTTPDLVELVRRSFEASNRRDLDARMSFFGPDAVFDMSPMGIGIFEGRAAIRDFFEDWWGAYAELEADVEEAVDLGNGVVFVLARQTGRPLDSSGHVEVRYASVAVFTENLIVRITNYRDLDEGRAAAERLAEERG